MKIESTHGYVLPYIFSGDERSTGQTCRHGRILPRRFWIASVLIFSKLEPPLDGEPLTKPATKPVLKAPETRPTPGPAGQQQQRAAAKKRQAAVAQP